MAEPEAVQELGPPAFADPRAGHGGGVRRDETEASEPPSLPFDLSNSLGAGEEVTLGQVIANEPNPAAQPRIVAQPAPRAGSEPEAPESRIGTTLAGRYRLERLIAKGGMGRVYLATQLPLERQVAIKILVNQRFDAEFRKRFFLEASTCARLVHRHIVTVHDYGEAENNELFMAMEYLDGIPLSKVIQKQVRLPSDRACKIALQICRALRTAHKTGIVHRDLKPGNVIVLTDEDQDGNDFIKVLDFGLVKAFEGEDNRPDTSDLTKSGTWLGSPRYMAPEQIRCQPVDPRTDIYSLGVILFHMLAGRPPFIGANSMEVLEQHLRDKPPSIADVLGRSDYAPELEVIVERCLKKDAGLRYQSMDELIGDLKAAYRLITGVSLHTESTLPTFAEIADPALAAASTGDLPGGAPQGTGPVPMPDTMALTDPSNAYAARVTGTIRSPLDLLEASNPNGGPVVTVTDRPDDLSYTSRGPSMTGYPPHSARSSAVRWVGLVAALLLVMVAGFLSVRLFGPQVPPVVTVRIDSRPGGADVLLDGRLMGVTPVMFQMTDAAPDELRTFTLRKPGFEQARLRTRLDREQVDLHATLVPAPPPPPPPRRSKPQRRIVESPPPAPRTPPAPAAREEPRPKRRKAPAPDEVPKSRVRPRSPVADVPADRRVRAEERPESFTVEGDGDRVVKESEVPVVE